MTLRKRGIKMQDIEMLTLWYSKENTLNCITASILNEVGEQYLLSLSMYMCNLDVVLD